MVKFSQQGEIQGYDSNLGISRPGNPVLMDGVLTTGCERASGEHIPFWQVKALSWYLSWIGSTERWTEPRGWLPSMLAEELCFGHSVPSTICAIGLDSFRTDPSSSPMPMGQSIASASRMGKLSGSSLHPPRAQEMHQVPPMVFWCTSAATRRG